MIENLITLALKLSSLHNEWLYLLALKGKYNTSMFDEDIKAKVEDINHVIKKINKIKFNPLIY